MRGFKSLKLYKMNLYKNRFFILFCFCIFTFSIFLDSFVSSKELNISELQLTYNNLSLFRQGVLYIPVCTIITMKLLEFTENTYIIMRLERKEKIWNQVIGHIVITNFMISMYLVIFSYVVGLLFTQGRYMEWGSTFILLMSLILLYTIGLSLFASIVLIIKMITGNKVLAYMAIWTILVPEVLNQEGSVILSNISFSVKYLASYIPALLNILKFGGITLLIFEMGRMLYKKEEVYNTKKLLMSGNNDEDEIY